MRAVLCAFLLLPACATTMRAGRNHLKPSDFEPLTELPWAQPGATLEGVLDAIFRETNPSIRDAVLAEYLRRIPAGQLGKTFELCIDLNGAQTPDELIQLYLPIWAERDPRACWKRTKQLLRLVGIEDGWLAHDSWKEMPRITVRDLGAMRASRFWIQDGASLSGFASGVDHSSLPRKERIRLMKEFTDAWFAEFGSWTGYEPVPKNPSAFWSYARSPNDVVFRFTDKTDAENMHRTLPNIVGTGANSEAEFEVAVRRWLQAEPAAAPEILKLVQKKTWPPEEGKLELRTAGPSIELLMIWARVDLPAFIRWADALDVGTGNITAQARGFLMSRVDVATRERWLEEVKEDDDRQSSLFSHWAGWDPKAALAAAATAHKGDLILETAIGAAGGVGTGCCCNTRSYGLGVIKAFDTGNFPEEVRKDFMYEWESVMECWADVDIGETARYGLDFIQRTNFAPKENLLKYYSGVDGFTDDGIMDRTFCALRVWAVFKPAEMKAWIAAQKDAEMRKALTWLLQHPWGTGPKE